MYFLNKIYSQIAAVPQAFIVKSDISQNVYFSVIQIATRSIWHRHYTET